MSIETARESLQHAEQEENLQVPESCDGSGLLRDHWEVISLAAA